MSGGYAVASQAKIPRIRASKRLGAIPSSKKIHKTRTMKLTIKQKIRNWLMNDEDELNQVYVEDCEGPSLNSNSFRLQVYGASGGTIIETTKYDRKSDENRHSLHVVTEDKDLGEELSKIITMEQLR